MSQFQTHLLLILAGSLQPIATTHFPLQENLHGDEKKVWVVLNGEEEESLCLLLWITLYQLPTNISKLGKM